MQMHGFQHTVYPDSYGFPKDSHYHIHAEMADIQPVNETNIHETLDLGDLK
jgi:hypothetical protein